MTKVAEPGEASKMREAAVAVMLACAAATLAAVILVPRTQRAPAGLVQLLPSGQMSSAIQLFKMGLDPFHTGIFNGSRDRYPCF